MKPIDFVFLAIVVIAIACTTFVLTGCSPGAIRITEEVIEDVAAEELKGV